jgi:hypothetical protein
MIASPPLRRLSLAAALALVIAVLCTMLLALPSASLARAHKASTHKASCHVTRAATHAKRTAKKCPATHKLKRTHASHRSSSAKGHKSKSSESPLSPEEANDEAKCEDGSIPSASAEGTFSCEDGSEPSCHTGLIAVPSSDGSTLLCEALPEGEPEPEES